MEWWQIVLYVVALAGGWFMSYFVRPWVQEKLALRRELVANYLLPFHIWCRAVYKEIVEFRQRYTDAQVFQTLSKTLVIIDYRELHDVLRETGKYIGKIEREEPQAATYLRKLENLVDNVWHGLQDDFCVNFDQSEHDTWMAAIIQYPGKDKLVKAISNSTQPILDYFERKEEKQEFECLRSYLLKQFPGKHCLRP